MAVSIPHTTSTVTFEAMKLASAVVFVRAALHLICSLMAVVARSGSCRGSRRWLEAQTAAVLAAGRVQ